MYFIYNLSLLAADSDEEMISHQIKNDVHKQPLQFFLAVFAVI